MIGTCRARIGTAIGALLLASPLAAHAHDDQAAAAEWIEFLALVALAAALIVVAMIAVKRT